MISYRDFTFKDNKLFLGKKHVGTLIPKMFQIQIVGQEPYPDIYNLTRAKDNLKKVIIQESNQLDNMPNRSTEGGSTEPTGALFRVNP